MRHLLSQFAHDLRHATRQTRRDPFVSVLSLAVLSIGLSFSAIMFALIDATLLSPLPYRSPSHLLALYENIPVGSRFHISYDDFRDWQQQNSTFESLAIYRPDRMKSPSSVGLQHVAVARVSNGFFRTLGVSPSMGRDFKPEEDLPAAPLTVVLTHQAWQNHFGSDPAILGKTIALDDQSFQVIGVLPAQFHFAPAGPAEFWITVHGFCGDGSRRCHAFYGVGRLKTGISLQRGRADLEQVARRIAAAFPSTNGDRGAFVLPLAELILGDYRPTLIVLSAGATLLLLIAILNVAGLLLVKAQHKQRDMAIRDALGASLSRQIRQFAAEGLLLSFSSFVLSVLIAEGAISILPSLVSPGLQNSLPAINTVHGSWSAAAFAAIAALLSAAIFAIAPLSALLGNTRSQALHDGGRQTTNTHWRRFGSKLMVGELAITVLLLVAAGLLARTEYNLQHVDLGVVPANLAAVRVEVPERLNGPQRLEVSDRILSSVRALPEIEAAGFSYGVATAGSDNYCHFRIPGRPYSGQGQESNLMTAGAGYFETVQATLMRGRFFTPADRANSQGLVVINQTMATHLFPSEDPIGKHILCEWNPNDSMQIIGVIRDIQEQAIDAQPRNVAYASFEQGPDNVVFLSVRAASSPRVVSPRASNLPALVETIRHAAPGVVVDQPEAMQQKIDNTPASYLHRSAAWLTAAFATIATLLAGAGLYGIVSYSVTQRTREIAVRLAIGAPIRSIYQLVLAEGLKLVAWGAALGVLVSLLVTSALQSLLFGVKPWDPSTLSAVIAGLSLVAFLACLLPSLHAARIPPIEALKAE